VAPDAGLEVPLGQTAQSAAPADEAKLPEGHKTQVLAADAPREALARPAAQATQAVGDEAPRAALHDPAGQGRHVLLAFAPTSADHVPEAHGVQERAPCELAKDPALHFEHAASSAPPTPDDAYPTGQGRQDVAPAAENCPAPQLLHTAEPCDCAAVPAGHAWQEDASVAPTAFDAVPALQGMQPDDVCPGAPLYVPAKHLLQFARLVAPAPLKKRPAGHGEHAGAPGVLENVPKPHGEHEMEPGGAKVPSPQVLQAASVSAPTEALAVPAGHARHEDTGCPGTRLKEPAAQGRHWAALVAAGTAP
jgi:hypothetical protein